MKIVALDIATATGVCIGSAGGAPACISVDLGKGLGDDEKFAQALKVVDRIIRAEAPDLVVVEAAIGGPQSSQFLVGLVAIVRAVCTARGVPVKAHHQGSIRKHFLGHVPSVRGQGAASKYAAKKAIKAQVINRCRALGWTVEDDNAADAAALWDFACSRLSAAHGSATSPLFGGVHGRR